MTHSDEALALEVNGFLRNWSADPGSAMTEAPLRWDERGRFLHSGIEGELRFSPSAIRSGAALTARDGQRAGMCMEWEGSRRCLVRGRAGIDGFDLPEAVVDNGDALVRTLEELEQRGLRRVRLEQEPWSGDYWPLFRGATGARYWDAGFPSANWYSGFLYIRNNPADWYYRNGSAFSLNLLAPSEKYDLLAGDLTLPFTKTQWARGEGYYRENGFVEPWMGICQGWAAAAIMMPRPNSVVRVVAEDREINFYPDDIKALASALWAAGEFDTRFVGGRCTASVPRADANGRIISEECFDTNPATWHLALTNQLGISKRSMIFDATYDYEVWNQPVIGYSYSYFNPQMAAHVNSLEQARVSMGRFSRDPYRSYRSSKAVAVVGIVMDLTYAITTSPNHASSDGPHADRHRTVRYIYDLELDLAGKVIGGEWYQRQHPDFLWVPAPGARAVSGHEQIAEGEWESNRKLPSSWKVAAKKSGAEGIPLARIVEALISFSR